MSNELRREVRHKTHAKVVVKGHEVPGYLRDLSRTGCRLSLTRPLELKREEALTVTVLANPDLGLHQSSFFLLVLWTQADPVFFNVGGQIRPLPGQENEQGLQRLFEYYQ
jgi:hypothetical protein